MPSLSDSPWFGIVHSATNQSYDGTKQMVLTTSHWSAGHHSIPMVTCDLGTWFQLKCHNEPWSFSTFLACFRQATAVGKLAGSQNSRSYKVLTLQAARSLKMGTKTDRIFVTKHDITLYDRIT